MNLLLDTHIWLWWLSASEELSPPFLNAINSPENRVSVSAISLWELNIKRQIGKLKIDGDIARASIELGLEFISFTAAHSERILGLPDVHKDPFDRALVAQAMVENSTLMTLDRNIMLYPGVRIYSSEA